MQHQKLHAGRGRKQYYKPWPNLNLVFVDNDHIKAYQF